MNISEFKNYLTVLFVYSRSISRLDKKENKNTKNKILFIEKKITFSFKNFRNIMIFF